MIQLYIHHNYTIIYTPLRNIVNSPSKLFINLALTNSGTSSCAGLFTFARKTWRPSSSERSMSGSPADEGKAEVNAENGHWWLHPQHKVTIDPLV